MTLQRISLTEVNRRMKQVRQFAHEDGFVVLTSHDKPTLIVMEVERGRRLLEGVEQLAQLLAADNLVEIARVISAAEALELDRDREWIRLGLEDLGHAERVS